MGLDVKGAGGVIIVEPTVHPDGGEYRWITTGEIPVLGLPLAEMLRDVGDSDTSAATDAESEAFMAAHMLELYPWLHYSYRKMWEARPPTNKGSAHDAIRDIAACAAEESRAGYVCATTVYDATRSWFIEAVTADRGEGQRKLTEVKARAEFYDIWAWAIGKAIAKTDEQMTEMIHKRVAAKAAKRKEQQQKQDSTTSTTINDSKTGRKISLVPATKIISDKPVWAWEYDGGGRIQLGSFAALAGRPSVGKSTVARWIAAGYSNGMMGGCWYGQPQNVAYLAPYEESLKYTVKPGLAAVGADMDRISFPEVIADEDKVVQLRSLLDEKALTEELLAAGVSVVIVDPVMSTIGAKVDIYRNNETREFIEVWPRIATALDGIVVGVVHFTKGAGADILAAINGSSAFGEVARAVFGLAKDPTSEEDHRIISQANNSTGREDFSLVYHIAPTKTTTDTGETAEVGRFEILGRSERTVSDVLSEGMQKGDGLGKEAADWLEDYLEQQGNSSFAVTRRLPRRPVRSRGICGDWAELRQRP